jgi:glycine betaine/proline transport system permease protein
VIATIVFAMPPVVRLTTLGIRQVREELLEAGRSFGSTDAQLLWKIQLPNALPSIMAGVNQTIMMALSMVVVASMIGAGGLGEYVLSGIQRLDIGIGFEGGLGVVLLAIILDRLTESFGVKSKKSKKKVISTPAKPAAAGSTAQT